MPITQDRMIEVVNASLRLLEHRLSLSQRVETIRQDMLNGTDPRVAFSQLANLVLAPVAPGDLAVLIREREHFRVRARENNRRKLVNQKRRAEAGNFTTPTEPTNWPADSDPVVVAAPSPTQSDLVQHSGETVVEIDSTPTPSLEDFT